jgi:hypothetical protein
MQRTRVKIKPFLIINPPSLDGDRHKNTKPESDSKAASSESSFDFQGSPPLEAFNSRYAIFSITYVEACLRVFFTLTGKGGV